MAAANNVVDPFKATLSKLKATLIKEQALRNSSISGPDGSGGGSEVILPPGGAMANFSGSMPTAAASAEALRLKAEVDAKVKRVGELEARVLSLESDAKADGGRPKLLADLAAEKSKAASLVKRAALERVAAQKEQARLTSELEEAQKALAAAQKDVASKASNKEQETSKLEQVKAVARKYKKKAEEQEGQLKARAEELARVKEDLTKQMTSAEEFKKALAEAQTLRLKATNSKDVSGTSASSSSSLSSFSSTGLSALSPEKVERVVELSMKLNKAEEALLEAEKARKSTEAELAASRSEIKAAEAKAAKAAEDGESLATKSSKTSERAAKALAEEKKRTKALQESLEKFKVEKAKEKAARDAELAKVAAAAKSKLVDKEKAAADAEARAAAAEKKAAEALKGALQKVQPTTSSTVDAVDTMEMDVDKKVAGLEAENAKLQESKDRMMELLKKQKNKIQKLTAEKEQAVTEATNANQKATAAAAVAAAATTAGTTTVAAVSFSSSSSTPSSDIRLGSNGAPSTPKAALQSDVASSMATNTVSAATNDAPSAPPAPVGSKGGRKRGRGAKKAAAAAAAAAVAAAAPKTGGGTNGGSASGAVVAAPTTANGAPSTSVAPSPQQTNSAKVQQLLATTAKLSKELQVRGARLTAAEEELRIVKEELEATKTSAAKGVPGLGAGTEAAFSTELASAMDTDEVTETLPIATVKSQVEDARRAGFEAGKLEGMETGRKEGFASGRSEGLKEGKTEGQYAAMAKATEVQAQMSKEVKELKVAVQAAEVAAKTSHAQVQALNQQVAVSSAANAALEVEKRSLVAKVEELKAAVAMLQEKLAEQEQQAAAAAASIASEVVAIAATSAEAATTSVVASTSNSGSCAASDTITSDEFHDTNAQAVDLSSMDNAASMEAGAMQLEENLARDAAEAMQEEIEAASDKADDEVGLAEDEQEVEVEQHEDKELREEDEHNNEQEDEEEEMGGQQDGNELRMEDEVEEEDDERISIAQGMLEVEEAEDAEAEEQGSEELVAADAAEADEVEQDKQTATEEVDVAVVAEEDDEEEEEGVDASGMAEVGEEPESEIETVPMEDGDNETKALNEDNDDDDDNGDDAGFQQDNEVQENEDDEDDAMYDTDDDDEIDESAVAAPTDNDGNPIDTITAAEIGSNHETGQSDQLLASDHESEERPLTTGEFNEHKENEGDILDLAGTKAGASAETENMKDGETEEAISSASIAISITEAEEEENHDEAETEENLVQGMEGRIIQAGEEGENTPEEQDVAEEDLDALEDEDTVAATNLALDRKHGVDMNDDGIDNEVPEEDNDQEEEEEEEEHVVEEPQQEAAGDVSDVDADDTINDADAPLNDDEDVDLVGDDGILGGNEEFMSTDSVNVPSVDVMDGANADGPEETTKEREELDSDDGSNEMMKNSKKRKAGRPGDEVDANSSKVEDTAEVTKRPRAAE